MYTYAPKKIIAKFYYLSNRFLIIRALLLWSKVLLHFRSFQVGIIHCPNSLKLEIRAYL